MVFKNAWQEKPTYNLTFTCVCRPGTINRGTSALCSHRMSTRTENRISLWRAEEYCSPSPKRASEVVEPGYVQILTKQLKSII